MKSSSLVPFKIEGYSLITYKKLEKPLFMRVSRLQKGCNLTANKTISNNLWQSQTLFACLVKVAESGYFRAFGSA